MSRKNIIAGLDIGTSKVSTVIGEITDDGGLRLIGVGEVPSFGIKKGMVVDINSTIESIRGAVELAEEMAQCSIVSAFVSISGPGIKNYTNSSSVVIKGTEIEKSDVSRVVAAARAVELEPEEELIHSIVQGFTVDGQNGIKNPRGMSGDTLDAEVYIVTAPVTTVRNIKKCVKGAGLDAVEMVFKPIAVAESVLTDEEKELGVILVDIGGGSMEVAMFVNSCIWHTAVFGVGGGHFTNDIAVGLRTPFREAERIKIDSGCLLSTYSGNEVQIQVPGVVGGHTHYVSSQILNRIVEPRAVEIFETVWNEVKLAGNDFLLSSGVVLTGGTSMMHGFPELAEEVLGMPVRVGSPRVEGNLAGSLNNCFHSAAVGILQYAALSRSYENKAKKSRIFSGLESFGGWLRDYF